MDIPTTMNLKYIIYLLINLVLKKGLVLIELLTLFLCTNTMY